MDELDKLDPLYEKATEALELHNLLQSLPTHKENAEKYNRHKRLHDKSVEMREPRINALCSSWAGITTIRKKSGPAVR